LGSIFGIKKNSSGHPDSIREISIVAIAANPYSIPRNRWDYFSSISAKARKPMGKKLNALLKKILTKLFKFAV
jgi:hypothetical protein